VKSSFRHAASSSAAPVSRHGAQPAAGLARALATGALSLLMASPAQAEGAPATPDPAEPTDVEVIRITGRRSTVDASLAVDPGRATPAVADTAEFLKLIPGADVVNNGPLAGQVQYRGLSGTRMNVLIDGAHITAGGPNWMDPPLHYAPRPLLESLAVERGIASVSSGLDTLGGTVRAKLKRSEFGDESRFGWQTAGEVGGRSADASFAAGGIVSGSNDRHRFHFLGSAEKGGDVSTPDGDIHPTKHQRYSYGGGYGYRFGREGVGEQELGVDYRYSDTSNTGNPALPMDTRFVRTHLGGGEVRGRLGSIDLLARFNLSDVDHGMDNFSLRAPPGSGAMFRSVSAQGEGIGYGLIGTVALWDGELTFGADGHVASHDMKITNPNNAAFFVDNINDAQRDRYGFFAEWVGSPLEDLRTEVGLRYTRVQMDAGRVDALPAQMPGAPQRLRYRFNDASRNKSNNNVDVVGKVAFDASQGLELNLGVARKTRSPDYLERYLWLPLEVSGGLADGNNYVGTIGLDPEVSYEVTGGFSWQWRWLFVSPHAFYRRVDDYIQGTPSTDPDVIAVSTANGDPTPLEFTNVDAELYGIDADWAVWLPAGLQLDGTLSYVRGRRRDIDDDLYRISPLHGRATLSWTRATWTAAVEGVFAANQTRLSRTNGETTTDHGAWGIMNLFLSWEMFESVVLTAGVDNLTDELYQDHLSGFNRVANSDISVGTRLPGRGRNFYGLLRWRL